MSKLNSFKLVIASVIAMLASPAAEAKQQCTEFVLANLKAAQTRTNAEKAGSTKYFGYNLTQKSNNTTTTIWVDTFSGNAGTWYDKARADPKGGGVSASPQSGYIMVFAASGEKTNGAGLSYPKNASFASSVGHVALVTSVNGNEIRLAHANWSPAGKVDGRSFSDVAAKSDDSWITARMEYQADDSLYDKKGKRKPVSYGSKQYAVKGFINTSMLTSAISPKKK